MVDGPRGRLVVRLLDAVLVDRQPVLLLEESRRLAPDAGALRALGLSAREAEILRLVAMGKDNLEIADGSASRSRPVRKHLERMIPSSECTAAAPPGGARAGRLSTLRKSPMVRGALHPSPTSSNFRVPFDCLPGLTAPGGLSRVLHPRCREVGNTCLPPFAAMRRSTRAAPMSSSRRPARARCRP